MKIKGQHPCDRPNCCQCSSIRDREVIVVTHTGCDKMATGRYLQKEATVNGKFQIVLYNPVKSMGYIPDNGSEVFVNKIPEIVDEWELAEYFHKAGDIFQIRLMMSQDMLRNRGFGYVTYMDAQAAKRAVTELVKLDFLGVRLGMETSLNNCRLFVSGFPTDKTKDEIWMELKRKGIKDIVDVIMYRSYSDRAKNRGFVFVEFMTHEYAAYVRARYSNGLTLWGKAAVVDWSIPVPEVDTEVLDKVRVVYMRNLEVTQTTDELKHFVLRFVSSRWLEKVYKFKNYAFLHLRTREAAERLLAALKRHFEGTVIEVEWAKPPNRYNSPLYRRHRVSEMSPGNKSRTNSSSSSFRNDSSPSFSPVCSRSRMISETSSETSTDEIQMQRKANSFFSMENPVLRQEYMKTSTPVAVSSNPRIPDMLHQRQSPFNISLPTTSHRPIYPRLESTPMEMGQFSCAFPQIQTHPSPQGHAMQQGISCLSCQYNEILLHAQQMCDYMKEKVKEAKTPNIPRL